MIRKLFSILVVLAFAFCVSGCANEYKVEQKKEVKTESQPKDVKPGEMIAE